MREFCKSGSVRGRASNGPVYSTYLAESQLRVRRCRGARNSPDLHLHRKKLGRVAPFQGSGPRPAATPCRKQRFLAESDPVQGPGMQLGRTSLPWDATGADFLRPTASMARSRPK